jgi:hypothetical protein
LGLLLFFAFSNYVLPKKPSPYNYKHTTRSKGIKHSYNNNASYGCADLIRDEGLGWVAAGYAGLVDFL